MATLDHVPVDRRPRVVVYAVALSMVVSVLDLTGCQVQTPLPPVRTPEGILEGLADRSTQIHDLTHPLNTSNAYWPGEGYEPFSYETFATIDEDGVLSGRFAVAEHTGTHLDAPNHFVEGQLAVDQLPLEQLFVPAVVIDVRDAVSEDPDYQLTTDDLALWESTHGRIEENTLVLMYSGWESRWQDFDAYKNADDEGLMHFPGFSEEATEILVSDRQVTGLGIDTLSVDYGLSEDFGVHHISHSQGRYHLENLANLGSLPPTGAWVIVAPIKIEGGTGGPSRVFALVGE